MTFHAIIVAGGSGQRSGGKKQWMPLGGKPVLRWSIDAFAAADAGEIVVVVPAEDLDQARLVLTDMPVRLATGGTSRAQSVQNGLDALRDIAAMADIVMVHDAARPLLTFELIEALRQRLQTAPAAILALPVTDSLKKADGALIVDAPARTDLWRAQTPQAFRFGDITDAYAAWPADEEATDEAMVADRAGIRVEIVEGAARLQKLTYPEDFKVLEAFMSPTRMRIGQGFDAHRWGPGESVWLCGVEIVHDQTLIGHSDADAGLHALTDALLGAAGLGDIGDHFPPTDPQWKGASSDLFLKHACDLIRNKGGEIVNLDVTLICERPKIKPHREAMCERLAQITGTRLDQVSVKATTTEKMGFTGREEGLAAQAVCLITLP
ncbi:bifunctional 2-C-methyl-D-erythritol 4-phosphate cytidylyltransferase/2-C-methyl-D-erythritol 2,4-cyclodiphosphate synthase [Asticcacaulis sp. YBE204]|uniref:bifunctional 2-C-methyl-D-erythritol 4-phosphate cytidylyltransferase/2-C-methyl-D-erythritol 2,4-cyclodiphosphate synthase n=1 Tax=Asticcacaulis sp. YBE204 TaxID=1282363 RepID=UPI0003C3B1EC|nr:bifunctional 2-C-methyl-D-erythritol 4-phosphate cytidylyltransferase/2-C-methyl-D-erythritol 2,4-cyclodiphosphate synthase [Asticcacaulis sp. YBE204]ESQ77072.1 2-C-methyl-D-erythritol 4-phosphate cytidylyltransferase [Asticcacaulis sp. YBE204]